MEIEVMSKKFGKVSVIIDNEDIVLLNNRKVFITYKGYPAIKYKNVQYKLFLKCDKDSIIDHINRNKMDNRKENLRVVTIKESNRNRGKRNGGVLSSKYKGISRVKESVNKQNPYVARIQISRNQRISLGYYSTEIEAAKAYNLAAIKYFGEYAMLNIIKEIKQ